jgi:hypothetical protein
MGKLTYDSTLVVDFDDRVLAHLQVVIGAKLRRNEAFYFSWRDDAAIGDGRSVVWLHPAIPLYYKFNGGRVPAINRAWIEDLMTAANSSGGLRLVPEPQDPSQQSGHHDA